MLMTLKEKIEKLINQKSLENGSNTPDFVLAQYLLDCLEAFDNAVNARQSFHNHKR
jgi:hypothetical protein